MDAQKKLKAALNKRFAQKVDELDRLPATMGNGDGKLFHPTLRGYIYCIVGNAVETVLCNRVPANYGARCWVGYANEERTQYQVLAYITDTTGANATAGQGYAPAKRYEWNAVGGGQDPLHVHQRAISTLKLGVSSSGGFNVDLYRGFVWSGSQYIAVPRQDIDLSSYVPVAADKELLVLITINTSGTVIITAGSEVDLYALTLADLPAVPANTAWVCGAVRLYEGQTEIQESRTNTDFVDLRFASAMPTAAMGAGDPVFIVDGAIIAATNVPGVIVITKDVTISEWYVYCKTTGSASDTICDINKNGVTIFTTQSNRPTLAYNDPNNLAVSGTPDFTSFVAGDILTLDIDQVATGAADLVVVGKVEAAGGADAAIVNDLIVLKDVKAQNTAGGTATAGSWQTRDMNTEETDDGSHCTLADNQFTLDAGTYRVNASAPAYSCARHQARLQNITDAATTLTGTTEQSGSGDAVTTRSFITGQFTISEAKTFELQHRVSVNSATNGYGIPANFTDEVYSVVVLNKVA